MEKMTIRMLSVLATWVVMMGAAQGIESPVQAAVVDIHVADHGAVPNDGKDDAVAIRKAIAAAKTESQKGHSPRVIFAAGQYDLLTVDAASGKYIQLDTIHNATVQGAVDASGNPTTRLVRANPVANRSKLPDLFYAKFCNNLTVRNLLFDNSPYFYTAGIITQVNKTSNPPSVVVDIFPGHPRTQNMGSFVMGNFDVANNKLLYGRLTYNTIGDFQPISGGSGRLMRLAASGLNNNDPYGRIKVIDALAVGQGLFWFQGYDTQRQFWLWACNGVTLENLHTVNAAGFAMDLSYCKGNITATRVKVAPEGNRIAVNPRDGFKLAHTSGTITMNQLTIEGCQDDAQNVHGEWANVVQINSATQLKINRVGNSGGLVNGTTLGFVNDSTGDIVNRTIASWSWADSQTNYLVNLTSAMPSFVAVNTRAEVGCMVPDAYTLTHSTFKNIGGGGSIIKANNVLIHGNTYQNINNIGIQIGAEFGKEYESTLTRNAVIKDNLLINCGQKKGWHFGDPAAISLDVQGYSIPMLRNIRIFNNVLKEMPNNGIYVRDSRDIILYANTFIGIGASNVVIDPLTTSNISNSGNNAYVGRWRLNGNGNDWVFGRNGVLSGSPSFSSTDFKEFSRSLVLDGIDDFMNLGSQLTHLPKGSAARTIAGWVKVNANSDRSFFDYGNNSTNGGKVAIFARTDKVSIDVRGHEWGRSGLSLGSGWNHIAVVYPAGQTSSDKFKVYVNGVQLTCATIAGTPVTINTGNTYATLGKAVGGNLFNGKIDDFRIYNRELTASEIADLAQ